MVRFSLFFLTAFSSLGVAQVTLEFLTYSMGDAERERAEIVMNGFREATGITVRINEVPVSELPSRQSTMILAGGRNDVMYGSVLWSNVFAANEWMVDLTDRLGELDIADWLDGSWDSVTFDGRVYGIPVRRDAFGLIYNKRMFEEAGVESCPVTTDDFLEVTKLLTRNGVYGIGIVGADHPQTVTQFISYLYMFNNPVLNEDLTEAVIDSPSGVAALQFYADLVNVHGVAQPTAATDTRADVERLFYSERVAMILNGPWLPPTIAAQAPNIDWGVCLVPRPADGEHWALGSGWDLGISVTSPYPEETWEFIKFAVDPANAPNMVTTFPARHSALDQEAFSTPAKQPWIESLLHMRAQPASPVFSDAMLIIQETVNTALSGRQSAADLARDMNRRIQDLLDEFHQ